MWEFFFQINMMGEIFSLVRGRLSELSARASFDRWRKKSQNCRNQGFFFYLKTQRGTSICLVLLSLMSLIKNRQSDRLFICHVHEAGCALFMLPLLCLVGRNRMFMFRITLSAHRSASPPDLIVRLAQSVVGQCRLCLVEDPTPPLEWRHVVYTLSRPSTLPVGVNSGRVMPNWFLKWIV
jgi:hypothetical protein